MASNTEFNIDNVYDPAFDPGVTAPRWPTWNVGRIRLFGIFVHLKFVGLLLAEMVVVAAASYHCYAEIASRQPEASLWWMVQSMFAALLFMLCFAGLGLYSSRQTLTGIGAGLRYLVATAIVVPMLWALNQVTLFDVAAADLLVPMSAAIVLLAGIRVVFGRLLGSNLLNRRVLVIGSGKKSSYLTKIADEPDQRGFTLVTANPDLRMPGALVKSVKHNKVNEVVVAFDDRRNALPASELLDCRLSGVNVVDVQDFLERETGVISFEYLQPSWLIFTDGFKDSAFARLAKRVFDIIGSSFIILLTLPVILGTCLAIKLDRKSPGPIIYRQIRVGQHGKEFKVLKFRSMRSDAEKGGQAQWATQNDSRVTAIGAVIRKYRIDELPQLFNVLTGSMSLVGPRPERPVFVEALSKLNNLYMERHRVKPGVTGWAQLRFPYTDNEEDSIKKLEYDMYYMKNQGLVFDFYILLQTVEVVLFGKGSR